MRYLTTITLAVSAIALILSISTISSAQAEEFNWIMNSASKAGTLDNGQGHPWKFSQASGGKWEVENPDEAETATVTSVGNNKINFDGFPNRWEADGVFIFSRSSGKCFLKSDHSTHEMEWDC